MNEFEPRIVALTLAEMRGKMRSLERRIHDLENGPDDPAQRVEKATTGEGKDSAGRRIDAFYFGEDDLRGMGSLRVLQEAVAALLDEHTQPFYRRRLAGELRRRVDSPDETNP